MPAIRALILLAGLLVLAGWPAGPLLIAEAQAARCGGLNQRACKITERIPTCDRGLTRDGRTKRCVRRGRAFCGGFNQRPSAERAP